MAQLRKAVSSAPPEAGVVLLRTAEPVKFPPSCPNCGNAASRLIRIERCFPFYVPNDDDTPNRTDYYTDSFSVPFCDACARAQATQQRSPSPWTPLRRIFSEAEGFAGLVVIAIGFMFVPDAIRRLRITPLLLACLPWLTGYWLLRKVWKTSQHMTVPKPAETDLAVDFTPVISLPHEPSWRAFQFRQPAYAAQFEHANADRIWNPQGEEAQAARSQRRAERSKSNYILGAIVVAILLWQLWEQLLSGFFR